MIFEKAVTTRLRNCQGNALILFLAGILPLLFAFGSLSFDINNVFSVRDKEQAVVNSAALLAAKYLPYKDEGKPHAAQYLLENSPWLISRQKKQEKKKDILDDIDFHFEPDRVTISYAAESAVPFAGFFSKKGKKTLTTPVSATAKGNNFNVAIFVDNSGAYLAPDPTLQKPLDARFTSGSMTLHFHEADLVAAIGKPIIKKDSHAEKFPPPVHPLFQKLNTSKQVMGNPAVLTQQCFNPRFSAFKEVAIKLTDYLANFRVHQFAVHTGSSSGGVHKIRELQPGGFQSSLRADGRIENPNIVFKGRPTVRDQHCLSAAEQVETELQKWRKDPDTKNYSHSKTRESNLYPSDEYQYGFPAYGHHYDEDLLLANGRISTTRFTDDDGNFLPSSNHQRQMALREAIWSTAVRQGMPVNIRAVLREAQTEIFSYTMPKVGPNDLESKTTDFIQIFLGHFPHQNGNPFPHPDAVRALSNGFLSMFREAKQKQRRVAVNIAVLRNVSVPPYNNCVTLYCKPFWDDFAQFEDYVLRETKPYRKWLDVKAFRVADPGSLAQDYASYGSLMFRRNVMLVETSS